MTVKNTIDLKIRLCKTDDFAIVFKLFRQLWPNLPLDFEVYEKVYKQALVSKKQKSVVALLNNQIVGFCTLTIKNNLWQAGNLGYLDVLVVDETIRGRGIGKKLIDKITTIAVLNKCKRIELDSGFHRNEAHAFYEKLGYQKRAYLFSKSLDID